MMMHVSVIGAVMSAQTHTRSRQMESQHGWLGELKSDPHLRSYWKLMVARNGLVFFGVVVPERRPLL